MKITIIYRVCDKVNVCSAYSRCFAVSKQKLIMKCIGRLKDNIENFKRAGGQIDFICIYDNCSAETIDFIRNLISDTVFIKPAVPGNAGSFCQCVEEAVKLPDNEIVYFLEDDYLMLNDNALQLIWFNMHKLSEYEKRHIAIMPDDYPDRYTDNTYTGIVRITQTGHFIKINSTTCTFVAFADSVKQHKQQLLYFINWPRIGEAESVNQMWKTVPLYNPVPAWTLHSQTKNQIPLYISFDALNNFFTREQFA